MILYLILGFLGISILGTILHFTYELFGHNKFLSVFMAVNESVWEHIKMAIVPTMFWAVIGLFVGGLNNFAFGVFIAILTMQILIPLFFYTYTAFTKKSILAVDITIFYVAIALAMLFAGLVFSAPNLGLLATIIGVVGIVLMLITLPLFTFFPPKCNFFKDPLTQKFGHAVHKHLFFKK